MKKSLWIVVAIVIAVGALSSANAASGAKRRAVSLRVLQSTLQKGPSKLASELCGITRITGFIADKKTQDIILVGQVDPSYPALYLDDFVVAFRNINHQYIRQEGHTRYYSAPGCSIDPDPRVLGELNDQSQRIAAISDADRKREGFDAWQEIGRQPQKVRVLGVPFDTRFAKIMVDADYYMKRLTNGSVDLGIKGFDSLMDMEVRLSEKNLDNGKNGYEESNSLNRFWFCPGESTFSDDDGMVTLEKCDVKLLTENEFLTKEGQISGMGRPDPMAKIYADNFSTHYGEIAQARSIYKELEGLFRFVALANIIKDENAFSSASLDPNYLIKNYRIANVPVNRSVVGQTNIREITHDLKNGSTVTKMIVWHMSCGGVAMDVHPKRVRKASSQVNAISSNAPKKAVVAKSDLKRKTAANRQASAKKKVLTARRSSDALFWDLPD